MSDAQILRRGTSPPQIESRTPPQVRRRFTDYIPYVFIFSLLIPYRIEVGPLLLSPHRIFLMLILLPCLFTIISGRAGRILIADCLLLAHALWMCAAFFVAHGPDGGIEPAGVHFIEAVGAYLVARCFIRSAGAFYAIVRFLFISIVIMLPFMLAETLTGSHYLNSLLALFGPAIHPHVMDPRLGLERAFGVFDHPILLGVYCVSVFSLTYYVLGYHSHRLVALFRTGLVAAGTACSLSAGPLLVMVVQSLLMAWDHMTRRIRERWRILAALVVFMYVLVDIISNRTPFHVIVTYLTFNTANAYNRILIWYFGSAEVMRNPLFGIGLGEWERPYWMSSSIDNFWLVLAVQGGVPAFLLFAGAVLAMCFAISRLRFADSRLISYRRGWMIAIVGLAIAGGTVHYWKTMFCLLVFLIGSCTWMLNRPGRQGATTSRHTPEARRRARATIPLG